MEDRIKNLSLDQKAKLYYMMLLRKGVIDTLPEDPKAAYVQSMMDEPASSKFSEPMGFENLKETATELGYLTEAQMPEKITFTYTDPGFSFYAMYYLINNDRKKVSSVNEVNKFLKNLGVDKDISRRYRDNELDIIVKKLEAKGIEADHNAFMDVS